MFTVYVLYAPIFDKIYIGFTSDLQNRLIAHNQMATKGWTIKFRPWSVIHTEYFNNKKMAMNREKQLKSAQGRAFIRSIIKP